ncbi:MAG TPA: YecA family protein [Rhodanobacteraceae bacterium]|nr:YecA family protein [Rhodanobacteraceae bacterium]
MSAEPEPQGSLPDSELEQLDRFLRTNAERSGEGLLLDGVHGLLTALAIGPEPALPEEWLPEVLQTPFDDPEQGREILGLLAKLNDSIPTELEGDNYEPVLGELADESDQPGDLSAAGWCEGFSRGIDLRAAMWETRLAEDTDLMELLGPIMALAVDDGILAADVPIEKLEEQEYEACLAQIPEAVNALAHYWRVHPPSERERTAGGSASSSVFPNLPARRGGRWVH